MNELTWLASYPKSGNTWVRLLYSAYLTGECDINAIICTTGDTFPYPYNAVVPKQFSSMEYWEWAACASAAALQIPQAIRERPLLIKTHHAYLQPFGYRVIPQQMCKRAIYVMRDPRDIVISHAKHMGTDVDQSIDLMGDDGAVLASSGKAPQFVSSWEQHVQSWLSQRDIPVLGVKYEDLIEDQEKVLAAIMKFLGEPHQPKRIARAAQAVSLEKIQRQESLSGFGEASEHSKFFGAGGSTWRTTLTDEQANRLAKQNSRLMNHLGYTVLEAA